MTEATTVPVGTPAMTPEQVKAAQVRANTMRGMADAAGTTEAAPPKPDRNLQLSPARFQGREYSNNDHVVTIESTWTLDDVVKPIFWSSVWQKMRRYDKVSVRVDDGSWYAELLVTQVGTGYVFVQATAFIDFNAQAPVRDAKVDAIEGFEIRERGPFLKWCVIRKADSKVIAEKCDSKIIAEEWLQNHQTQQARTAARS